MVAGPQRSTVLDERTGWREVSAGAAQPWVPSFYALSSHSPPLWQAWLAPTSAFLLQTGGTGGAPRRCSLGHALLLHRHIHSGCQSHPGHTATPSSTLPLRHAFLTALRTALARELPGWPCGWSFRHQLDPLRALLRVNTHLRTRSSC